MAKIKLACADCGKDVFKMPSEIRSKNIFCDKKCLENYREKTRVTKNCEYCGVEFVKAKSNLNGKRSFCSRKCKNEWQREGLKGDSNPFKNRKHSKETIRKIRKNKLEKSLRGEDNPKYNKVLIKCEECGESVLKIPYLLTRNKHQYCSVECRIRGQSKVMSGIKNPNYNPNLTSEDRKKRMQVLGYTHFKNSVLRRDDFKCVICESDKSIVVHHLNSYHWDKNNRLNPNNAVVLCYDCHRDFHNKYGHKYNTKKQFEEFKKTPVS